ncbi:nitric oxide-associated protein 1-like [Anopheles albimanus]|uniref:G domain-containing protein n=1 Tax=Anopheles albimanus TaxID=7167 RepID=A0A182FMI0_ANOAL|nr:nitric oxide-associated protein 1-like [Anopheles albimanus]XP_035784246.1 nitric oxide-associated protein 1-like [Anopheles albimanus]
MLQLHVRFWAVRSWILTSSRATKHQRYGFYAADSFFSNVSSDSTSQSPDTLYDRWKDKILYSSYLESNVLKLGYRRNKILESKMKQQEKERLRTAARVSPFPIALTQLAEDEQASADLFGSYEKSTDTAAADDTLVPYQMPYEHREIHVRRNTAEVAVTKHDPSLSTGSWMSDYEYYDEAEQEGDERLSFYGTPDPHMPASQIPCGGCGALLHCIDPSIPGYLPSQLFKGKSKEQLTHTICQRCHFLKHYNVAINVSVSSEDYIELLLSIRSKKALALLLVDLTDFPCSIWPGMADILGPNRPVIVVGNKVDLIPCDCPGYLENVRKSLTQSMIESGFARTNIMHVSLISASTGYGIEELITKLHNVWGTRGDVYLVGCTNVGKSTLFNALLRSDLCKVQATDLVQKATASPWPGTTIRTLKFPILRPSDYRLYLRTQRLQQQRQALPRQQAGSSTGEPASLIGHIGSTFQRPREESFDSFSVTQRNGANVPILTLNEKSETYAQSKWCYDTPGVVHPAQILDLLTTEEILLAVAKRTIRPRAYLLRKGMTLFLAGLARLDYLDGPESVRVMVYAAPTLPTLIAHTGDAVELYRDLLGSPLLAVPFGSDERLKRWPALRASPDILLLGTAAKHIAAGDIVLSSAGWIAVHLPMQSEAIFRPWTPDRRGVYTRQPSLLPHGLTLRGKRIRGSLSYRSKT